jgi:hypothetical protein
MILNSPTISGSLTVTGNIISSGSITLSGSVASASYAATASFIALAQSASNAVSAATASFVALAQSASNAVSSATASFANAFTVASTLTAQTLVVQTITSSVDFVTGSTRFGSILGNTHVFSGSVTMNPGGLFVSSSGNVGIGTILANKLGADKALTINGATDSLLELSVGDVRKLQMYHGGTNAQLNNLAAGSFTFITNGISALTLASTGAATFSSSVQVGSTLGHSLSLGLAAPTTDTLNHIFAGQGVIAGQAAGGETDIGNNWYYYSGWKYRLTNAASNIKLNGDVISFERAASGTANAAITFLESMRITSGGNIFIGYVNTGVTDTRMYISGQGTTSSTYSLVIKQSNNTTDLFVLRDDGVIFTGTAARSPVNDLSGAAANLIVAAGGNLQKSTASSIRFKENVIDWDGDGLNTILALKPKTFTYKENYYSNPQRQFLGLIAEDVAEVSNYLADFENEDGTGEVENVRYANIVVPLIKAIQELKTQNDALQSRIETLESK